MTTQIKKTLYYVIVDEKNGRMLLQDCKLPFYWNKNVAEQRAGIFPGFKAKRVNARTLNKLILKAF